MSSRSAKKRRQEEKYDDFVDEPSHGQFPRKASHKRRHKENESPRQKSAEHPRPDKLLRELRRAGEYEDILTQKDTEYAALLKKHEHLKKAHKEDQERILSKLVARMKTKEEAASSAIATLKKEAQEARAKMKQVIKEAEAAKKEAVRLEKSQKENAKLLAKVSELEKTVKKAQGDTEGLRSELTAARAIEETYRLLTATEVKSKGKASEGKFTCKLVNRNPYRVMEFELGTAGEDILYKPQKIEMKGAAYPGYFKEKITFEPIQTPLLMRNLMSSVYGSFAEAADQSQIFSPSPAPRRRQSRA